VVTFVVLAAGRGSRLGRLGDELPKCLLPLDGRAVLSHQFALAPPGARLVVVTGYRADQVEEYVRIAHPDLDVTIVREENWGRGPGASLLEARGCVEGDLVFTACDTLWDHDSSLWDGDTTWLALAPLPVGTPAARWCRAVVDDDHGYVLRLDDKTPDVAPNSFASTALGRVHRDDLDLFWSGLERADQVSGEVQLSAGLESLIDHGVPAEARFIRWTDVGDEQAYRQALAATAGYDPLKPDQVTYVLPSQNRVVKWHVDPQKIAWRVERAKQLGDLVPATVEPVGSSLVGFEYEVGCTVYRAEVIPGSAVPALLDWWDERFWSTRTHLAERPPSWRELTTRFYRDKTFSRVMALDPALRSVALDAVTRVDWDALVEGCVPGIFHGDLTFANVIMWDDDWNVRFRAIDWREDFAGETTWGDLRYDLGKLLSGTVFHWENARHGDFRRWDVGPIHRVTIENAVTDRFGLNVDDVRRIAALCMIGSAVLHAAPMDEILVTRGCRLLQEVT
jgi:dTDP-glucose pyrophosphorylase